MKKDDNKNKISFGGEIDLNNSNNREDFIAYLDGALSLIKMRIIDEYDKWEKEHK